MKKSVMLCMAGLSAVILPAAEVLLKPHITDPRWSKSADGKVYTVQYDGKTYPCLDVNFEATPNTCYKLSFEVDASEKPSNCNFRYTRLDTKQSTFCTLTPATHKRTETFYFFSGASKQGIIRFNMDPKQGNMVFSMRNLKLESFDSPAAIGNMLPDPEFEDDAATTFWRTNGEKLIPLADDAEFFAGSRSLCFRFDKKVRNFLSCGIPIEPGKKYEFSFFAKADKKCPFWVIYSMWSPFGHSGKHLWLKQDAGFTTEWKEYKFVYTVPVDQNTYPDLAERIGTICFTAGKNIDSGTVYFDKMSFREIK